MATTPMSAAPPGTERRSDWTPRLAAAVLGALLFLAGVRGAGAESVPGVSHQPVTARLQDYRIELDPARVSSGSVGFVVANAGPRRHNLRVRATDGDSQTADLAPGERATLTVTFATPGTYVVFCDVAYHEQKGMASVLTVTDPTVTNLPVTTSEAMPAEGPVGAGE